MKTNTIFISTVSEIFGNKLAGFFLNLTFINRFLLIIFFFLITLIVANAQSACRIEGKLINPKENKPVEFATVAAYKLPDSTLVNGASSDDKGEFAVTNLNYGNYFVKISCMGFKTITRDNITLNESKASFLLGNVNFNEEEQMLEEVKVEGERIKGTTEADKTVYALNEKVVATAHSGLDVLKQIPAVQVDFSNNISLEGKGNILILVDGRKHDKDYLNQLDPKRIDKVEVMTNPSVKYDADVSGVINVILKKEKKVGVSGRIQGEIPVSGKLFSNSAANLEYGYDKFRLYTSAEMHAEGWKSYTDVIRKSYEQGNNSDYNQYGSGKMRYVYLSIDYGFDWFINDKNTLNFYGNIRPDNGGFFNSDMNKEIYNGSNLSSFFKTSTKENNTQNDKYYSVFYKRTFTKPSQEFTLDINYFNHDGSVNRKYTDTYYLLDKLTQAGDPIFRTENILETKDNFGLKADYVHPVNENLTFSTGYHNYTQWLDYNVNRILDAEGEKLDYYEMRNSMYANASGKIKAFTWQTGVRFELSDIEINKDTKNEYSCLLPQASVQLKVNDKQSVKLNYRKSINRPGIFEMNPFVTQYDSLNISKGNPYLKPSYDNKIELTYNMQAGSSYLAPGVYVNFTTDNIQNIIQLNDQNVSENLIRNIGNSQEYGVNFSGSVKIAKWWQLNPYFCVYYQNFNGIDAYDIQGKNKYSWRMNFYSAMTLPKKFTLGTYVQYNAPYINAQNSNERSMIYFFGLEKEFSDKIKVSFNTLNPFMDLFNVQKSTTENDKFKQVYQLRVNVSQLFTVGFTYNFSNGKQINKLERQKEVERTGRGGL